MQIMSVIECEAFALKFALDKFQIYVQESHVTCFVVHQPLRYLQTANLTNKKLQSYALSISGYNVTIEYISGKKNRVADMLSRCRHEDNDEPVHEYTVPGYMEVGKRAYEVKPPEHDLENREVNVVNLNTIRPTKDAYNPDSTPEITTTPEYFDTQIDMKTEQMNDKKCMNIITQLKNNVETSQMQKYILFDELLYYLSDRDEDPILRLYIPEKLSSRLITEYHDNLSHVGLDKCFDAMRRKYFFPNMYRRIYKHLSRCITCASRARSNVKIPVQYTRISHSSGITWSIDTSGPYRQSTSGKISYYVCRRKY